MRIRFKFEKTYQVLRIHGVIELFYRVLRFFYRLIPVFWRLSLKKQYYKLLGYNSVGDPLRVYNVNLSDINYVVRNTTLDWIIPEFGIKSGEWDLDKPFEFDDSLIFQMFKKHFKEDIEWEKTEHYRRSIDKLEQEKFLGVLDDPVQSVDKYEQYLNYLDGLYQSIKDNGYRRQEELRPEDDFAGRDIHPAFNEIQVFIGRDGRIICESGIHRTAIAKILGIDEVFVRTRVRHKKWQQIRDEVFEASSIDELSDKARRHLDHPDLQDIVPEEWRELG